MLEKFSTDLTFSADGTGQCEESAIVRLQSEAGVRQFGVLTFRYEAANQRVERIEVRVRKRPELADHLGQIYERQGKKEAAIHAYQRALAVNLGMDEVRARLEKLTAAHQPARIGKTAVDELGKLRTTAVPSLVKKTGSAEFFVLFSPGKIEDAQFISGAEGLRDTRDTLLKAQFDVPFPDGSSARIVRRGILACSAYTSPHCQFTFILPADTRK